jgi:hypothetical protein
VNDFQIDPERHFTYKQQVKYKKLKQKYLEQQYDLTLISVHATASVHKGTGKYFQK